MWTVFGHSLSYDDILDPAKLASVSSSSLWWIAFLLFWAATAKSAQIPLYVWLPDAMEGPTPVSALIHAATMVTAGVYLIARSSLLLVMVPSVQMIVAVIGCATALLAALIALTQTDLKRVMAYSTVSQLGYMFMALGAGVGSAMKFAVVAAMFHLFTHAFFKALLFLASGSVMHAMGGVIDMRRFGGLRHRLPITCWTFAAGGLALAGFPLTAGFFSKDEILSALGLATHATNEQGRAGWVYGLIYWTALFTAFLTAFYTFRAFFMTFFGPEKLPARTIPRRSRSIPTRPSTATTPTTPIRHSRHDEGHVGHESPPLMWVPLVILAGFALFAGLAFGPWTGTFEHHLARTPGFGTHGEEHGPDYASMALGSLAGLGGIALAWFCYARPNPIPGRLAALGGGRPYRWSRDKFYVDEIDDRLDRSPDSVAGGHQPLPRRAPRPGHRRAGRLGASLRGPVHPRPAAKRPGAILRGSHRPGRGRPAAADAAFLTLLDATRRVCRCPSSPGQPCSASRSSCPCSAAWPCSSCRCGRTGPRASSPSRRSLATLALSLLLFVGFDTYAGAGPQFRLTQPWLAFGGSSIQFALGLDGISLCLFVLSTVLVVPGDLLVLGGGPRASPGSLRPDPGARNRAARAVRGAGRDPLLHLLRVHAHPALLPDRPLRRPAADQGGDHVLPLHARGKPADAARRHPARRHLPAPQPGPDPDVLHPRVDGRVWPTSAGASGPRTIPGANGGSSAFWTSPQVMIFMLLFAGFAIKVPLFPFHTWLPLAHVEAPTAGSILLAGVLLKVGGYGFLRFNMAMVPLGAEALYPMLATVAVAGILYGALAALAQTDVKRLVAYSSVSHMGFIALGIFSMTRTGTDGAVIQMVNHGVTTGALFACVGVFYERYHTREMSEVGGLWNRLPLLAFFFILGSLGSAAVPGLNGFVGEFPILLGTFARSPGFAIAAAIGMVLGAYYLLLMLQRVIFGPLREPGDHDHGHGEPIRPVGRTRDRRAVAPDGLDRRASASIPGRSSIGSARPSRRS